MAAPETRMWSSMELVHPLEPTGEESPLARARLHRQLTVEETARRAGITAEEVRWLEEGRVYRFPKPDDALIATALYATALGLDNREARELAGLPVPPQPIKRNPLPRLLVVCGVVIALAVFATLLLIPRSGGKPNRCVRLHHQEGRPRGQLHVSANGGVLPAEMRRRRFQAGEATWRSDQTAPGRNRRMPALRHRRPCTRTWRVAPTKEEYAGLRASS